MRKNAARILGLLVTLCALTSIPKVEAQEQACTLFCIQGYHCCIQGSHQTCVPETQACK